MSERIREALSGLLRAELLAFEGSGEEAQARVPVSRVRDALIALRDGLGFNMLVDLTACDLLRYPVSHQVGVTDPCQATQGDAWKEKNVTHERFELTYRLLSLDPESGLLGGRFAVKCRVSDGEIGPPSIRDLWPVADWLERELWDMFGVRFSDRPDIRRILLYEEFVGHPLRKDYPINKRQPLLASRLKADGEGISPAELRPKLVP